MVKIAAEPISPFAVMTAQNAHARAVAPVRRTNLPRLHTVPIPSADGLIWGTLGVLAVLAVGGVSAGLWWVRQPPREAPVMEMRVGSEWVAIEPAYRGPLVTDLGREVGLARLRVTWPSLEPASPGAPADVHITLGPADPATDPQARFAQLARFLGPGAWSNPGGLVVRSFKKGTPYEADELYMSVPDGRDFFARCAAEVRPGLPDEGCFTLIKHGPFDIHLRFPREALTQWQELDRRVRALVDAKRRPG